MNPIIIKNWNKGLITKIEKESIARGGSSDCLNWQFLGDHIELRRGQKRLFLTEIDPTSGYVTGLKVGKRNDGVEIPLFTYARKALYYNVSTEEAVEIDTTDFLPLNASGEEISIDQYKSLAGDYFYLSSPNSSIYKIPVANPGSRVDLLSTTFRGKMKIKQSRMFLWDRKDDFGGSDKTGLYLSYIDKTTDTYSFSSAEVLATGDGVLKTFSGTLAFKTSNQKETCFLLVVAGAKSSGKTITAISQATSGMITAVGHGFSVGDTVVFSGVTGMTQINNRIGVIVTVPDADTFTINLDTTDFTAYSSGGSVAKSERFIDDKSGNLTGSDGGTGTINYATGAFSVTFNVAVINGEKIVAQYFREDSTNNGIADFSYSSPRTIGQGTVFRQDDGGAETMNVFSFGADEYAFHRYKTWVDTLTSDDTNATNLIYRDRVGIPNWRAAVSTGDGVYYMDALDENPSVKVLEYGKFNTQVVSRSISDQLDLTNYSFDKAVMFEWGNYICLGCRTDDSTINNRLFMYNRLWKTWEIHSYRVSVLDVYGGTLLSGDSGSPNLYTLFSGLADEDAIIENYIIIGNDFLDKEGAKALNRMKIQGMIGDDQNFDISYSVDNEPFVFIQNIAGNGSYVDISQRKMIGNETLGADQIGGGEASLGAIFASPYEYEFLVGTKKFERIRIKIEAKNVGYVSISELGFIDIRDKGMKLPPKYVQ